MKIKNMTKENAIKQYKKHLYDLAKNIAKLSEIKESVGYINDQMGWDGLFEFDFDTAISKLANVQAAMVCYSFEDEYRKDDIHEYESSLNALKNIKS